MNPVFPEDFIQPGDFDETDAVRRFFSYLHTEGGLGILLRWYDISGGIDLIGGDKPWKCFGVGRYMSGLRRSTPAWTGAILDIEQSSNFTLSDFGLDGNKRAVGAGNLNHGLALGDCRDFLVEDFLVRDWGVGGGMHIDGSAPGVAYGGKIDDFHLDGMGNVGNGLNLVNMAHSHARGGIVEGVNGLSPCVALQFKGSCFGSDISDCRVRDCFSAMATHGGDPAYYGRFARFSNVTVSEPSPYGPIDGPPRGLTYNRGWDLAAEGIHIDGGHLPGFVALYTVNTPLSSPDDQPGCGLIKASVFNCDGLDSHVLYLDSPHTTVHLDHLHNVGKSAIRIGPDAVDSHVIIGQYDDGYLISPWDIVEPGGTGTNVTVSLLDPRMRHVRLADDTAVVINVPNVDTGILTVSTNGNTEQLHAWVRVSSAPAVRSMFSGAGVAVGTGVLTNGSGDGIDGKLNVYAAQDAIYIKNRTNGTRTVGFDLKEVF